MYLIGKIIFYRDSIFFNYIFKNMNLLKNSQFNYNTQLLI